MPKYRVNGDIYNIPEEKVSAFEKRYPNATVDIYDNDGAEYSLPVSEKVNFQKQFQNWSYSAPAAPSAPSAEKIDTVEQPGPVMPNPDSERNGQDYSLGWKAAGSQVAEKADTVPTTQKTVKQPEAEPQQDNEVRTYLEEANRKQVAGLSDDIDVKLNNALTRLNDVGVNEWNEAKKGGLLSKIGYIVSQNSGNPDVPSVRTNPLKPENRQIVSEVNNLEAAKNAMTNARELIEEADKSVNEGNFGGFVKGSLRGFGDKLFDVRTWDMGASDSKDNVALYNALKKFDKGEKLTESEQMLLDAKSVELATNAYFGSYIGRGYKAGMVTAQSLPFMIEMAVNPASATGTSMQSRLAKYALDRFSKRGASRAATILGTKAAGMAGRAIGDAAGAAIMAGTTGAMRVAGDAVDRINGSVETDVDENGRTIFAGHEKGESTGKAIAKAFTANAIENHSEMLGEYFEPALGSLTKLGKSGMNKIGLGKVTKFIDEVHATDAAKLIDDFHKYTKWNGTIGEYAEEVAGNIENAILVGDSTLDSSDDTGVFNLDQNIDTFLGVALMGGVFSTIRTAAWRTPKYRARKEMEKARDEAKKKFGDQAWQDIEDRLAEAGDEGMSSVLSEVIIGERNPEREKAILDYAKSIKVYEGTLKGDEKHRELSSPEMTDLESSYENGYTLATPQEVHDAKIMFEYQQARLQQALGMSSIDIETLMLGNEMGKLTEEQKSVALDYLNAEATFDGVIDRVRDDIDNRISSVNAAIDASTNSDTGKLQPARLVDDRAVHIISGIVRLTPDGTMVDIHNSEDYIIIRDDKTGKIESVSPSQIVGVDAEIDPESEKKAAESQIRGQIGQQKADIIDGVLQFNPGDVYTLTNEQGQSFTVQVAADGQGIVDNGDGTINVILNEDIDANTGLPRISQMSKEQIENMAEATNMARLQQYEQQKLEVDARQYEEDSTGRTPENPFKINDRISFNDVESGSVKRGIVESELTDDGKYEIAIENDGNIESVSYLSPEELSNMRAQLVQSVEEQEVPEIEQKPEAIAREQPVLEQKPVETGQETAMSRIPTDAAGNPEFEKAQPSDTWNALVEINDGNAIEAEDTARQMYDNATKLRDKALASKPKPGTSVMEIQKNKAEYKARLNEMQNRVNFWSRVLSFPEAEKKQTSKADEESTPAVPAKQQTNDNLAKGRRLMQEKGTYYKEDSKLGDYLDFEDFALRMIANGRVKFVWKSDPNNSAIKGLAAHLGFAGNESERKRVFSILANADKGGLCPDEAAQELVEIYNSSNDNESIDTMQALDTILDIIRSYGGKTRDMMNAAIAAHANINADERANAISLDEHNASELISSMSTNAEPMPIKELTPENWNKEFGESGEVDTPIGVVKMGENQLAKLFMKGRADEFGMIKPTLNNPDVIVEEYSNSKNDDAERESSYLFVKTFERNGEKIKFFTSVTVKKDGLEVVISNHFIEKNALVKKITEGNILYIKEALFSNSSEKHLAENLNDLPDLLPTQENNASSKEDSTSSGSKDTNIFEESNIEPEKPVAEQITEQRKVVNTEPTEAQKEAGNYRMGHVKIDGMDVTIENPKGSIRKGRDADGKEWQSEMHNDYGYIRGTKAVDNDHIDVFLSDDPEHGNVYVIDQVDPKTGKFDESKVMYGFSSEQEARDAYLSNYEEGWKGLGKITEVTKEEFKKWIDSSTRKTKPFSEYRSVKPVGGNAQNKIIVEVFREWNGKLRNKYRSSPQFSELDNAISIAKYQVDEGNVKPDAQKNFEKAVQLIPELYFGSGNIQFSIGKQNHKATTSSGVKDFAEKYGVSQEAVEDYANGMRLGTGAGCGLALQNIRRDFRLANSTLKFAEFSHEYAKLKQELFDKFGDYDKLKAQQLAEADAKRDAMEAARKRIEEEQQRKKAEYEARIARYKGMSLEELDSEYFKALENNDEVSARDIVDEVARRNGYTDVASDYQGVGAWAAPSRPGGYTDEERRASLETDSPDLSLEDISLGYTLQPDDIFDHPERYMQSASTSKEAARAIKTTLNALKNGNKDAKIKVFRAVPLSVKEGRLRNGDWVTPSRAYADMHGNHRLKGEYRVIEEEVPAKDLWWDGNDVREWGYDDGTARRYANVENNTKLNDVITKDDAGNIIPPSRRFDSGNADERYQISGRKAIDEGSEESRIAYEAVKEQFDRIGIPVELLSDQAMREMAINATMLDTALPEDESSFKGTVISSIDGAKILRNLDNAIDDYQNIGDKGTKTFLGDLASALGSSDKDKSSQYATFETKNGQVVTIRISNHNATVSNFDNAGESNGISIVISRKPNEGIANDGDAHIVEFFYPDKALNKADGKPLVEILKSIKQSLYSGEYKDTTGLAQREEVNAKESVEILRTPDGIVYGAAANGKIYLNQEHLNPNTPIHEYTHLWFSALEKANPELYKRGVELMRQLPIWEEVKTDPNYAELSGDDAIASECLSRLVGDKGADKLAELAKKAMVRGDIIGTANRISLIEDFKDWLKKFWTWVRDSFVPWTKEEASRVSVDDIQNLVLSDLAKGVNPLADAREESELKKTNDKFNEQLETFTIETADRYYFNLGRPSSVLLSAGIENKPIRLHGSKVAKKVRKHGFQATELRDLPKAIAHPIAVFDNLGREGNRSILTELKTDNGNVLVSIDLGRGTEVDFNIVSSAFGKNSKGILGWINGGKMKFVDKEKALNYLHLSAPIAEASDNAELLSAAKIVKEFENPSDKERKPEFQFIGEKGAAHMDKVEEATIRLDNLSIARQMEDADKDAKTIKLATGWERGADGKWRYEISDANIKDTIDLGKGISEKRFEEDMLWNSGRLGDVIDAPEIFEAYPQLKDIHIETDSIVNDMPSNGEFDANSNRITIHADRLKYLNSILNHEIQHAIQHIEGFATGGTPEHIEKEYDAAKTEWRARAYAHELEETAKELGGEYNLTEVENALGKEYKELGMEALLPDKETRIKGANYFARGYADRSMDEAIKRFRLDESTRSDFNSYDEYRHLAGEVEARNVSARLGMTPDERRRTLALETEDVAREDQIILNDALNGNSHYEKEPEIDRIVREAKENGTYMKAPNGKPTNLNERQWAQVRTRAFKKWFGDWEKAARIEKLRRSEPVIISGQEHEGKYELNRESAKAWMKDNLRGSYANEDTKNVITIGRKGVNKVTSHSMGSEAHLKSIVAIPEMLKKAIFITREQATKTGAQYPEYEYYVVGLKIGGVDYTAKVTIGVDENGNKFYDHALTEIEKGKLLDQKNGQAAIPGFISTEINPSVTKGKDTKLFSILQTNSSKIVDENGEPKVVYHGSPYRFFRFDKTKLGQSTGADSAKEGFFFTDNKELAELFSRYSLENLPVSDVEQLVKDRLLNMSENELNDAYEVYRNDSPDYLDYADETDSPNDREYLEISGFLLDGVSEEDAKRKYIQDSIESKIEGGYFSDMEEIEEELSSIGIEFGNNEQVFLNIESPVVDGVERDYFHNGEDVSPMTPVLQNAKRIGRDGVVFTGIVESGQKGAANQYVAFEPNQIKSATDNVGTFDGEEDDIRYRDSDRMDAEYMSAIEAGDMHKAGRMVEAAFKKAFPDSKVKHVVYHGVAVSEEERQFPYNSIREGHFTDDEGFAEYYAGTDGYVYKVFLDIESPLVQDFRGQNSDYAKDSQGNDVSTRTFARRARESNGKYDGAIISNVDEYGNGIVDDGTGNYEGTVTDYIPVRPEQVYSAELVVYDDNGQVIPLSRRFENGNPDIRYKHDETGNGSRTSQDVEAAATKLAESLGVKVRIVRDVNEIEHRSKKVQENQRKSKGWFNTDTGEIVVVLPNATGIEDVQATILHEAVGHKGLRELVGDDRFDDFLDKVYAAASLGTRKKIVDQAKQNHWDFRLATEEYIAGLAENGFAGRENRTLFEKIKDFFRDMLSRAKIALGVNIGDNELRYMLWRTYQMRTSRGVLAKAEDISMQQAMKVGNFRNEVPEEASGLRFRNSSNGSRKNLARDIYEEKTRIVDKKGQKTDTANLMRRLKEAYVDSMQSLKYLQDAVAEETGKPVEDFENAYLAENAMSSKNKAQTDIYLNKFFNPIKVAIRELQKNGVEYDDIVRYLMAKHGLERNVVFSKRDAQRDGAVWDGTVRRDYSGLTELTRRENDTSTPSIRDITSRANEIVHNFEKEYYVDDLWSAINNATKETLRTSYVDGLLTKDNYEMVRSMFDYYIPLRGWNENVASVEYDYLSDSRPKTSQIVKAATGRTTISDDPIATIAYMGQSAIIQGNRNMMKQKLLNLALNHKTGLLTVNRQWEVQDPITGEWLTRNPVIPVDSTPEEIADIVSQFEADMKAAEKNGTARISRGKLDTGKHITAYEGQEHVVKVKRGGIEYCIYLNGNPRAAQAVNGMTNPDAVDSWLIRKARIIKNFMARMFTSQNPAFIISNLSRDVIFAGTAVFAKEDSKYTALYTKNIAKALAKGQLLGLVHRFETGRLDDSKDVDRYFGEFIRNGGETGFTQLNTVDDFKRDLNRFAKEMKQGQVMKVSSKVWNGIWDGVEFMNRCAEDVTRFSVYMTSRQMGRSVERSISDAKEITVNFNRKGSGGFGARVMNFAYIFFNAAIQALANAGKIFYEHPVKSAVALSTFSAAGFLAPLLAQAIISAFGGDDDAYWDLPEWVRRNNFVFYVPWSDNKFLIIPISQELRPFYALGEVAMSVLMGKEDVLEGLRSVGGSFMDLLPVDFMGNGNNLAVSLTPTVAQPFAQLVANSDYFGKPIYRRNDYNRLDPAWTKAYKGTSSMLINASKWLNEVTGGDDVKRGWIDPVNNPAVIEHLFESYLGGVGKTINKTAKTISMIWNPEMRDVRNVPIVSTFVQESDDERVAGSQLNREYGKAMEEFRETEHTISGYKRKARMGSMEYADKLSDFMNTPEFKKYSKMKGYASSIAKLRAALKKTEELNGDVMDAEYLQEMLRELKQQMLEELKED